MTKLKGKARVKANKKAKNKSKNNFFLRRKNLLSNIIKWDNPILKETCSPVEPDEDISETIKLMKNILKVSENGLGIAASQIGIPKRLFVTRPNVTSDKITVFVNASIIEESEEREKRGEGCLSYPGIVSVIERPAEITVEYEDEEFKVHSKKFKGLDACVVCHEHDHTLGVCLVGDAWKTEKEEKSKRAVEVTKEALERNNFISMEDKDGKIVSGNDE